MQLKIQSNSKLYFEGNDMQETFKAGTQYGDYRGTVAADDADLSTLMFAMRSKLGIAEDQYIVGYSFEANYESRTSDIESISVTLYLNSNDYVEEKITNFETINVIKVKGDISLAEFFGLFKQFEICLSKKGFLDNASFNVIN